MHHMCPDGGGERGCLCEYVYVCVRGGGGGERERREGEEMSCGLSRNNVMC